MEKFSFGKPANDNEPPADHEADNSLLASDEKIVFPEQEEKPYDEVVDAEIADAEKRLKEGDGENED